MRKTHTWTLALASLALWLSAMDALAATYYVGTAGSNGNACTTAQSSSAANRKRTINAGIACLASGDTLIVGDGVYDELISDLDSCPLCPPPSGTSPVAMTRLVSENLHGAILRASLGTVMPDRVLLTLQRSAFLSVEGFVLDDQLRTDGTNTAIWTDFLPANSAHLRFQNLRMTNFRSMGHSGSGLELEFINITADKIGWDGTTTTCRDSICNPDAGDDCHGYCHVFYTDGPGHLWEGGTFTHVDGWVYHGSPGFSDSIIRGGTILGYSSATPGDGAVGGYITSGGNNTIYNNTFVETGIPITIKSGNNVVVHNTIHKVSNCSGDCKLGINQQTGTPATIQNNLLVNHFVHGTQLYIYVGSGTGGTGNYLVDNGVPAWVSGNVCDTTQAGCQAFSPSCFFVNPAANDLRLCPTSPAISAGVNPGAGFSPDQAGNARPQAGYDAGALEFMGGGAPGATALQFIQQPSTTQQAAVMTPAVTVRVLDQFGAPISSTVLVTLAIGTNPGGSTLGGDPTQNVSGLTPANFNDLSFNNPGSGYTLVASSPGLASATSTPFTITPSGTPPVATALQFAQTLGPVPEDEVFGISIRVLDQFGVLFPTTASITLALGANPGGSTLSGITTLAAVAGVAVFDVSLNNPGVGYTLVASSSGLTSATSNAFSITPSSGVATALAFVQQPSPTAEDVTITPAITVRVVDQFGAPYSSTAPITLALGANPGGSTLSGVTTQAAVAGVATFGISVTNPGAGYTLVASSPGLTSATSTPFTITPVGPAPPQMLIIQQLSGMFLGP